METYEPGKGDLVFFEPNKWIGEVICDVDWKHAGMEVSHVGIVADPSSPPYVVENTLHRKGVGRESLHDACHPPKGPQRHLLKVLNPWGTDADEVLARADAMHAHSDYSRHQLQLAGRAALLRQMPCSHLRTQQWEKVHQFSRHLVEEAETKHGAGHFSGTCAGMVAEAAHRSGFDLRVTEPECQHPKITQALRLRVLSTVLDLAAVAWVVAEEAGEECLSAVYEALDSLPNRDELNGQLDGADEPVEALPVVDGDGHVRFGQAALHLVKELHRAGMVLPGLAHLMLTGLHVPSAVLDHMVPHVAHRGHARKPNELVYPALMSLGMMLEQLGCDYETYTFP